MLRSFVALTFVALLALPASAQDDHPYKTVKVGDFATYTSSVQAGGATVKISMTQTVVKKDDKEAVIKVTGVTDFNGMKIDTPPQEQTIDLTKPFDPTAKKAGPGAPDVKAEKVKEGKEKITVGGKEYDCTYSIYKTKATIQGKEVESEVKMWMSKAVPMGMVKMTTSGSIAGMKNEMTLELKEFGNKK